MGLLLNKRTKGNLGLQDRKQNKVLRLRALTSHSLAGGNGWKPPMRYFISSGN